MYKNTGVCRLFTLHKNKPLKLGVFAFAYQTATGYNEATNKRQPQRHKVRRNGEIL